MKEEKIDDKDDKYLDVETWTRTKSGGEMFGGLNIGSIKGKYLITGRLVDF